MAIHPRILGAAFAAAALAFCAAPRVHAVSTNQSIPVNPTLDQAVNGSWRTPAFVKRDKYRHPLKVLQFFGIRPDMTVIEVEPGGGWWTEIFAPYLKARGHLIDTVPPQGSTGFMGRARTRFLAKLKADPALYSKVTTVAFAPPKDIDLGPPDSADMAFTSRNLHDWVNAHEAKATLASIFKVLKPGGILAVTDHRAWPSADGRVTAKKFHRITEDLTLQLCLAAGFRLAGVSEVNANPKDPLDISVFRLPPALSHDTPAQKEKYGAIGESDVFVMKFVKP
ncbi:MAG: class I SAM-dependent methyltransferase [Rhodanobacteraceae bacterium]